MAAAVLPSVSVSNLEKIESFMNDVTYKEALESSANYNTRLCIERRLRLPFLDSQTGMAQNHSSLFMNKRQRMPGLVPGQIYTYPRQRWRKKRRQYLAMNSRAFGRAVEHMLDDGDMHSISQVENPALQDTDSKDSQLLLKDEVTKEWFYDEQDMLEMEAYDEPDPDSDLDYEESYSKRSKKRRGAGRGRGLDSPGTPGRRKGGGRGRKKASAHNFDPTPGDPDKPFACERASGRRGRQQPPPPIPPQVPPTLPPNLPPTVVAPPSLPPSALDDPPMPVLIPEKQIEPPPMHQMHPQMPPQHTGSNKPGPVVMPPPIPMHQPQLHHQHHQPLDVGLQQRPKVAPSPYCDFCLGNSSENKKTGVSEELVSCSDCGRSGHPTCLLFTANMKISVKKYRWQCIECKCCSVCGTSDNDDQLLFCDDCDRGYHMYCLAPPLTTPPEGSWSCKLCIDEFHK